MKYEKGSFITVPNQKRLIGMDPIAQTVFMWLCFHANQEGECYPSHVTIAREAGLGKTSVKKAISILVDGGLIEKENRKDGKKNQTNLYQVIIGGVGREATEVGREATEGVGRETSRELNPSSLTQSTEVLLTKKTQKFIQELKETMNGISVRKDQVEEIKKFVSYWTEPDKNWQKQKDPKIRYDHQKTWDMKRRIATWMKNSINFSGSKQTENKYKATMV
jgi:hypothetical protein